MGNSVVVTSINVMSKLEYIPLFLKQIPNIQL